MAARICREAGVRVTTNTRVAHLYSRRWFGGPVGGGHHPCLTTHSFRRTSPPPRHIPGSSAGQRTSIQKTDLPGASWPSKWAASGAMKEPPSFASWPIPVHAQCCHCSDNRFLCLKMVSIARSRGSHSLCGRPLIRRCLHQPYSWWRRTSTQLTLDRTSTSPTLHQWPSPQPHLNTTYMHNFFDCHRFGTTGGKSV